MMVDVRKRLAKFINAPDVDDVVLVTNTTHGINVVLHNIDWQPGDILVGCKLVSGCSYFPVPHFETLGLSHNNV